MSQRKRIRRGAAGWRRLLSRQAGSGESVSEFCRREGINAGLFRRWRLRLREAKSATPETARAELAAEGAAPFIDLGDLRAGGSRLEVRLELGGGLVLSLARG
jgi:hypothetical protein